MADTMNEKQGVAQQVIAERKRDHDGSPHTRAALDAAIGMHATLSVEARMFVAELVEMSDGWTNEFGPDVGAQCLHEVRQLCARLGLDLEGTDQ